MLLHELENPQVHYYEEGLKERGRRAKRQIEPLRTLPGHSAVRRFRYLAKPNILRYRR
jgi:hypothetical protein